MEEKENADKVKDVFHDCRLNYETVTQSSEPGGDSTNRDYRVSQITVEKITL